MANKLSSSVIARAKKIGPDSQYHTTEITSLSDFLDVVDVSAGATPYWFRGHSAFEYKLCPSALRYKESEKIGRALQSISEFRRLSEFKIQRPPSEDDDLGWWQLAQHYGLPTRLLDWTQNPIIALYFCCSQISSDGIVVMLNPEDLNRMAFGGKKSHVLTPAELTAEFKEFVTLDGKTTGKGPKTIAIRPTWNSERIVMQQGAFTIHGRTFELDRTQCASLVSFIIRSKYKERILTQLGRIGISQMFLFPELEHTCSELKRKI